MAYLLKLKKFDVQIVAKEIGFAFSEGDTRMIVKKKIMRSENYEEEEIKQLANIVVTERIQQEKLDKEEWAEAEKFRMEHELEREKLKIREPANHTNGSRKHNKETTIGN